MLDYEKLGAFYLGKRVDTASDSLTDELVLYDSKDLTTHAVIIGMTGSGKTGLGIGMIEEAAMDNVPVIAIDPKGDLGNLLLTFPKLRGEDFLPWINRRQASDKGQSAEEYADGQAALWKKGLKSWGQGMKRIATLRKKVDMAIYTPGSTAGHPVSVLQSFKAPSPALLEDSDLYADRVQATATSVLSLIGENADPVSSREHILISQLLDRAWREGRDLGIAELIGEIQNPPLERVGVLDIDSFYAPKDRFKLAMKLNNLLAAPGFSTWTEGEPLDAGRLFYTAEGKPRISVMSIAHLDDDQRMFFVCMLLSELIAWMRQQQGTPSLRAILYMDELFGFMPPVANPPSKNLFLTLLKQARAYGLGLVLSTQNPVDLDYRGLSNTGTWMIGRVQTERDKARVMEGLEGVRAGETFDKQAMERTLAGLDKRQFLLHNVHEDAPVVFNTRWVMSYMAGPMTRDQIKLIMKGKKIAPMPSDTPAPKPVKVPKKAQSSDAPVLPPSVKQLFVETRADNVTYVPRLLALTDVAFTNGRYKVDESRERAYAVEVSSGAVAVDWDDSEVFNFTANHIDDKPVNGATFADYVSKAADGKAYSGWSTALKRWIRQNETVTRFRSAKYKAMSEAGETEGEFRARLQVLASEARDEAVAKLRKRYASKTKTLRDRLMRAEQALEREQQQSSKSKMDTAISFGTAILGAVLGRKTISSTSASKMGTAIRKAGSARQQAGDVKRARETVAKVQSDLQVLDAELNQEIDALDTSFDAQAEELNEIAIRPKSTDIHVAAIGLGWLPYTKDDSGRLQPAWDQ